MKLRLKLIITIILFILILLLFGVGVWAASRDFVKFGGEVSLYPTDVEATVTASFAGTKDPIETKSITFNPEDEIESETWDNLPLVFENKNDPIVITITVKELSGEKGINVSFVNNSFNGTNSQDANFSVTIEKVVSSDEIITVPAVDYVAPGYTATYTITLRVLDANMRASGTLDVELSLENVAI